MTGSSLCIFVLFVDLLLLHTQPTRCRDLRSLISSNVDVYIFGKIDLALKILLISFHPRLRGNKTDKKGKSISKTSFGPSSSNSL